MTRGRRDAMKAVEEAAAPQMERQGEGVHDEGGLHRLRDTRRPASFCPYNHSPRVVSSDQRSIPNNSPNALSSPSLPESFRAMASVFFMGRKTARGWQEGNFNH